MGELAGRHRIESLDGLRGFAILLVVLFHVFAHWPTVVPYGATFSGILPFRYGWLGVELFFMISGFVIFMTLERCTSFTEFIYRRWLRLFPAMLVCSVIVFSTAALLPERPAGMVHPRDLLPGLTFIEPAIWEKLLGGRQHQLEGGFWSLFEEVKFYVLAGVLYFRFGPRATIAALLACFCGFHLVDRLVSPAADSHLRHLLDLTGAGLFGWFASGALFFQSWRTTDRRTLIAAVVVGLAAAALQAGVSRHDMWVATLVVVIFASALLSPVGAAVCSHWSLVFLGAVSYPLYLLHENMMIALIVKLGRVAPAIPAALLPLPPFLVVLGLAWLVAVHAEGPIRARLRPLLDGRLLRGAAH